MIIKLSPQRRDDTLHVVRSGDTLSVNGLVFDFARVSEGDTLPWAAISSEWFAGNVDRINGHLVLTILLPNPWNYSPEQAFPVPLENVLDGPVIFPLPLPPYDEAVGAPIVQPAQGVIDWTQLITKAMKDAAALAAHLVQMKADLSARNAKAVTQISRIQDRVDTLGYGIDAGEATEEDEAEQAALLINLKAWKAYKFALGKVTAKASWPDSPEWPVEPVVPVIAANPMARAAESV